MRFIKLKEVMNLTALARATVYKKISEGTFPKSHSLGYRAVAWLESDVIEWMENIIQQERSE
jgi:prophage regulatory protein